tara:strand:+ start:158 stop:334 length:177 start_codon:yes stop_codon:yes gene_type:complete
MKSIIYPDEAITCDCGFKGNLKQMETHFSRKWTFVNYSSPLRVDKNGHSAVKPSRVLN